MDMSIMDAPAKFSGSADCVVDSVMRGRVAKSQQKPENSVEGDKWLKTFCQKLLNQLNMYLIIASLALSMLLMNSGVIRNLHGCLNKRESPPPKPFFPSHAGKYFIDYYTGDGAGPEKLLQSSEIVIAMYYASWSRRCKRTRVVFETIAKSFSGSSDVSFAAVNCFYHHGECRKSYKTHTYPVIVAHVGKQSLLYTGLLASDYIYRWISRLRNPIRRLVTARELASFIDEVDIAVIAFFDQEVPFAVSNRFKQYIKAALIIFQHENLLDRVDFAVVTNPNLTGTENSSSKPWIQLKAWSYTSKYDDMNMTADGISKWIRDEAKKWDGLQWISPETNGVAKSEELLSILRDGPTVVLFLDRQVLYPHNWAVAVAEQTVMEYYACGTNVRNELKLRSNKREELVRERNRKIAVYSRKCQEFSAYTREVRKCCFTEEASLMSQCFRCYFENGRMQLSKGRNCTQFLPFVYNVHSSLFHNVPCLSIFSMQSEEASLHNCCTLLVSKNKSLDVPQETLEQCAKYKLARNLYRHIGLSLPSECYPFDETSVAGLSCGKNNSLRFVGVDVRYDDYILKRMRKHYNGRTVALIVDAHTERSFFMQADFSRQAFRDFLRSFHNGTLEPHVVSQVSWEEPQKIFSKQDNISVVLSTTGKSVKMDLLSITYLRILWYFYLVEVGTDRVLLIDVSSNDLPWHIQMDTLPAVLFFPGKRKSSSSRFPPLVPLTAPNLIAFILTRCQEELRWRLISLSCTFLCIKRNYIRLRRTFIALKNDITSLRLLALANPRHSHLFRRSIKRRSEQIRFVRHLLKTMPAFKSF